MTFEKGGVMPSMLPAEFRLQFAIQNQLGEVRHDPSSVFMSVVACIRHLD